MSHTADPLSGRVHDRQHFFKFVTAEAALTIIKNKSLKWNSPISFNDPFDHQAGFTFDLDEEIFARALSESMVRIISSDRPIPVHATPVLGRLMLTLRQEFRRQSQDHVATTLHKLALQVAKTLNIDEKLDDFNGVIQRHLLHARILCVTEEVNNIVMWSHYADQHRGVAFQLGCVDHLDNRLLAARRVDYTDKFIAFPNADEYAQYLTGERPIDMVALVRKIAYTKHLDWAYEREWRVVIPLLDEQPETDFSIYDEPPEVFQAMYLGCRVPPEKARVLREAGTRCLPKMALYHARIGRTSFNLHFERIDAT